VVTPRAPTPTLPRILSRTRPEMHLKKHMASFYIHDGAQSLTLQISGALTQGAAAELEQTWLTARSTLAGRELLVDLGNLISADDAGQTVLRRLARHGARFITASRLTEALAAEVSRRMPELLPAPRPSVWNRLACCLRTFCGTAKASLKRALPCGPIVRKLW
jgi:anti-anti-sigma regulatory factor